MGNISILLADDSITIQKVVGIIFGSEDYTLTTVDNGKAAVLKAQELQPDVMLIDAMMPGMSGYEVCEAIRKDASLATTPLLLLTGSFEPFDEDRARQCGADDHIVKPFESQQIVAKVEELYQLGCTRASGSVPTAPVFTATEQLSTGTDETFIFEPTTYEFPAVTDSIDTPVPEVTFQPAPEPVRAPDDPWGAFAQQPVAVVASAAALATVAAFEPDNVVPTYDNPPPLPVVQDQNNNIGASWTPVEEQTFEFTEEITAVSEPVGFEAATSVEPVVDQDAELPLPVVSVDVAPQEIPVSAIPALTEEQLKAAIMAASKETIERIVWEVVPDLAEEMIKKAIKRITEGK